MPKRRGRRSSKATHFDGEGEIKLTLATIKIE
jgi:hypothetical protein